MHNVVMSVEMDRVQYQLDQVVRYEQGELNTHDTIALFQELIYSGLVWSLSEAYRATALELMTYGVCQAAPSPAH